MNPHGKHHTLSQSGGKNKDHTKKTYDVRDVLVYLEKFDKTTEKRDHLMPFGTFKLNTILCNKTNCPIAVLTACAYNIETINLYINSGNGT